MYKIECLDAKNRKKLLLNFFCFRNILLIEKDFRKKTLHLNKIFKNEKNNTFYCIDN